MKRSAMIVIVLAVLGGIGYLVSNMNTRLEVTNQAPTVVTETVEKTVPELDKRLQQALTASSTDIEQAMEDARQEAKKKIESEIEGRVIEQMQKELDDRKNELEKTVSL